jgi:hypothetical protein
MVTRMKVESDKPAEPGIQAMDMESRAFLKRIEEERQARANQFTGVKTVLLVLSSKGMVYDIESLRQKVLLAYPEAAVFFLTTLGKPIGASAPSRVDLLIDFTGPGQRQGWFYSRKLRRMARYAVGRNAGLFRKGSFDRVVDEKADPAKYPREMLARERVVQREVLHLAGVPLAPMGDTPPDRGKVTPLDLPPMRRL